MADDGLLEAVRGLHLAHPELGHAAICLLFGSVAWLAVHLVERPDVPRDAPGTIKRVV